MSSKNACDILSQQFFQVYPHFLLKIVKLSIYNGMYGTLNLQRLIFLSKSIKETYVITKQRNQA